MRAVDLYSGIGGWSLGLRLAGVEVVASYEWWQPAIDTHNGNHDGNLSAVDIRKLELQDLPSDIDLVVGSPPCTEFSYSNRGGKGNLSEGMKDLVKFLEVVEHLKPRYWALENVPRVAEVLERGFKDPEHVLHRFHKLQPQIKIIDFSDYGAPQSRKRCIAGNIPFDLIEDYRPLLPRKTLGDVIRAVAAKDIVEDPVWGTLLPASALTEMQTEAALNGEELRMNREAKTYHPVYNNMAFPDVLDVPARTVTATCTRVSRESIVIADPVAPNNFRRLTVRERACLQGFPITYQFYGKSFAEKAKMIGNAIPPTFTYLIASAALGTTPKALQPLNLVGNKLALPRNVAPVTPPDNEGRSYPAKRSFRAALPGLRFKSGMRFDLSNQINEQGASWHVRFFFGPSKDIREVELDGSVINDLRQDLASEAFSSFRNNLMLSEVKFSQTSPNSLQERWTRRAAGLSPFDVVDTLGDLAKELTSLLEATMANKAMAAAFVKQVAAGSESIDQVPGLKKLEQYAIPVLAGFIIGDWFNTLDWHYPHKAAA